MRRAKMVVHRANFSSGASAFQYRSRPDRTRLAQEIVPTLVQRLRLGGCDCVRRLDRYIDVVIVIILIVSIVLSLTSPLLVCLPLLPVPNEPTDSILKIYKAVAGSLCVLGAGLKSRGSNVEGDRKSGPRI
jgi:hypothetical protein